MKTLFRNSFLLSTVLFFTAFSNLKAEDSKYYLEIQNDTKEFKIVGSSVALTSQSGFAIGYTINFTTIEPESSFKGVFNEGASFLPPYMNKGQYASEWINNSSFEVKLEGVSDLPYLSGKTFLFTLSLKPVEEGLAFNARECDKEGDDCYDRGTIVRYKVEKTKDRVKEGWKVIFTSGSL